MQPDVRAKFWFHASRFGPLEYPMESAGFMEKRTTFTKVVVHHFYPCEHHWAFGNLLSVCFAQNKEGKIEKNEVGLKEKLSS